MLGEKDPDVFVTVKKLVMVSLLEVFKDIIPGYYIRPPTEKEQDQRVCAVFVPNISKRLPLLCLI